MSKLRHGGVETPARHPGSGQGRAGASGPGSLVPNQLRKKPQAFFLCRAWEEPRQRHRTPHEEAAAGSAVGRRPPAQGKEILSFWWFLLVFIETLAKELSGLRVRRDSGPKAASCVPAPARGAPTCLLPRRAPCHRLRAWSSRGLQGAARAEPSGPAVLTVAPAEGAARGSSSCAVQAPAGRGAGDRGGRLGPVAVRPASPRASPPLP